MTEESGETGVKEGKTCEITLPDWHALICEKLTSVSHWGMFLIPLELELQSAENSTFKYYSEYEM